MTQQKTPGQRFRQAVLSEKPLQIVGTINAYCARMAKLSGHRAIYLSGAGVANASLGLPDLGMTDLHDVLIDAARITDNVDLPLLVDIDTGWGSTLNIARTIRQMIKASVAAVHIEDQVSEKRCGHRLGKQLVSVDVMKDRIKAAVDARTDPHFVIMARTDAIQGEGINGALDRVAQYIEVGADMLFIEAVTELTHYRLFTQNQPVPVMANITEFGVTPLFTLAQLQSVEVSMVLYPLSAFRAMNQAASNVYQTLRQQGTQREILHSMQTRAALYENLDYEDYEKKMLNLKKMDI